MVMHHIRVMIAGVKVYYRACLDRNREINHENSYPSILIEVNDLVQNDTVETLKIEIGRIDAKIDDFKAFVETELVETLKTLRIDMERSEEKIITKLKDSGQDSNTTQDGPRNENGSNKGSRYHRRKTAKGDEIQEKIKKVGIKKIGLNGRGDIHKVGRATKNRSPHENDGGNEHHDLAQNDTVETLKIEIDGIDRKINDFKAEIGETFKTLNIDIEKKEHKIITHLKVSDPDDNTKQGDTRNENGGHKGRRYNRRTPAKEDWNKEKIKEVVLKKADLDGGGGRRKEGIATKTGSLSSI